MDWWNIVAVSDFSLQIYIKQPSHSMPTYTTLFGTRIFYLTDKIVPSPETALYKQRKST
jgi:hypothetical protein